MNGNSGIPVYQISKTKYGLLIMGIFFSLGFIATACTAKPTEQVLVDSFFSGSAFLDSNGNAQLDPADMPLENATLIVTLQGGAEFGGSTDKTGNAFVTIPSSVEYPVTLRMEAPQGSSLELIGPLSITFTPTSGDSTKFLFSAK